MSLLGAAWVAASLAAAALMLLTGRRAAGWSALAAGLASAALWAAFGPRAAEGAAVAAALVAAAAAVALVFRRALVALLPTETGRAAAQMPLTAAFGLAVILVYAAAALFAPALAPHGEAEIVGAAYAPPSEAMPLGADQLGRDMLSRLIWGARNTIGIALATTLIAFGAGTLLGLLAATLGGWVDQLLGRVVDLLMSIPQLVFALLLLTILGPNLVNLVLVIALLYAPIVFRLARAVGGGIVVTDYVEAARLRGESVWYLITREVLPNAAAPLAAEFGLRFSFVFLAIAGLSFLGLGVQPPTADWGSMVRDSATLISFGEPAPLIPAGAIALLTIAVNFVVDWMLQRASGLER